MAEEEAAETEEALPLAPAAAMPHAAAQHRRREGETDRNRQIDGDVGRQARRNTQRRETETERQRQRGQRERDTHTKDAREGKEKEESNL